MYEVPAGTADCIIIQYLLDFILRIGASTAIKFLAEGGAAPERGDPAAYEARVDKFEALLDASFPPEYTAAQRRAGAQEAADKEIQIEAMSPRERREHDARVEAISAMLTENQTA